MNNRRRQRCALCGDLGKLCKSHIIPKALHKEIADVDSESGKQFSLVFDPMRGPDHTWKNQGGYWERLLCIECERHFNVALEKPFFNIWNFDRLAASSLNATVLNLPPSETGHIKLFVLSVLFRADAAQRPHWSPVNLGARHRETIRQMLMHENTGQDFDYPIHCSKVVTHDVEHPLNEFVSAISRSRCPETGSPVYGWLMAGAHWKVFVSSHNKGPTLAHSLSLTGRLPVGVVPLSAFLPHNYP